MDTEKKNTILIVDDENMNLKILAKILIPDYTLLTATNGKDAIEKVKEYKPDLILLDIIMPEMDGYETLAEIKKCEEINNIPVIFITGLDTNEAEEKGLALKAVDYITKPFSSMIVKLRVYNHIQIINQMRTIERMSMVDQLTNLPNRRCFDDRMNMEWKKAIREKSQISILIIDIDKFKAVNDTYGHQHGDVVLQKVANILTESLKRPGDLASRWGGEEFIVLLPNTNTDAAVNIAEKIRINIENTEIPYKTNLTMHVTASIGVNSQIPEQDSSTHIFISNADKVLYTAKDSGRNRVIANK